jgi:hypothetical protein
MEDLDYSLDSLDTDSYILNIDSGDRNRIAHPHPNEYSIHFSEPFRLVHGLEILDASIPNTMYTVDVHNNTLAVISVYNNIFRSQQVDYYAILQELQSSSSFRTVLDEHLSGAMAVVVQDDRAYEVPAVEDDYSGTVVLLAKRRVARGLSLEPVLGNVQAAAQNGDTLVQNEGSWFRIRDVPASGEGGMSSADLVAALMAGEAFLRPSPSGEGYDAVYFSVFSTTAAFVNGKVAASDFECRFQFVRITMAVGNYDVLSFQTRMLQELQTAGLSIDIRAVSDQDVRQRNQFYYVSSPDAPFVFNMKASGLRTVMGFDEYTTPQNNQAYTQVLFTGNYQLFGSMFDPVMGRQRITSPGLMDFSGIRYMTLHCPELESHMYSSLAYGSTSTGIGIFKMGSSSGNDITFLRFDFTKFHKKAFHPVGRLTRLTFRFELPDGSLYDFKGINHNIMMVIKFYVPKVVKRVFPSTLNPNYTNESLQLLMLNRGRETAPEDPAVSDVDLALVRRRERMYDDYLLADQASSSFEDSDIEDSDIEDSGIEDCYA